MTEDSGLTEATTAAAEAAAHPEPAPDADKTSKVDLVKQARKVGIVPDGLTKEQLVDQIETVRLTGRPPLAQVAVAAAAALDETTTVVITDGDQVVDEPALNDIPNDHPAVTGQED